MPSRVTITRRHTGRYYVGLDTEDFFELYGLVMIGMNTIDMSGMLGRKIKVRPGKARIVAAFKQHVAQIKAAAGPHDSVLP